MRILLLNDTRAHTNWGAQATPHALVKLLKAAATDVEVETIPHAWFRRQYARLHVLEQRGPLYRVGAIPHMNFILARFSRPELFYPQVADDFDFVLGEWEKGRGGPPAADFLPRARQADIIVFNGENTNYWNMIEARRACFLLWFSKRLLSKPTAVINVTAQLNTVKPVLRGMVQRVYPELDLVATREPWSARNLLEIGVPNVVSSADVVFGLRRKEYPTEGFRRWSASVGLQQPYFCLSASGLPVSEPREAWDGEVTALVRKLQQVVPNAVLVAKDGPHRFMSEVARRTGALFFGPDHEFHELWPLFSEAEFLVSGHFHYVIFAAMVGCPFVPLSANNHKMEGLCEQLEWPIAEPFDITSLAASLGQIQEAASGLLKGRENMSEHLRTRAEHLRDEVYAVVRSCVELARGEGSKRDHGSGV